MTMVQWENKRQAPTGRNKAMNDNTSMLATHTPPTLLYERHYYLSYKQK